MKTLELSGLREIGFVKFSTALLTGGLVLSGCGVNKTETSSSPSASSSAEALPSISTQSGGENPMVVFDDLNGGPTVIRVYPGVTESASDKESNGTFNDGDKVPAECKTEGRTVHSDPSVGEEDRTSNKWIRIHGTPGETQFATAVYVENPEAVLKQLPSC